MKAHIKSVIAGIGLAALLYGTLIAIAAISAWDFSSVPSAVVMVTFGVAGLIIGDAWEF